MCVCAECVCVGSHRVLNRTDREVFYLLFLNFLFVGTSALAAQAALGVVNPPHFTLPNYVSSPAMAESH